MDTEMQYLYKDGDFWTFMNPENYEQLQAGESAVGEAAQWLKDGTSASSRCGTACRWW
jgi:elongation factor P